MNKFWSGGFLYNPRNEAVLLHKRDSNTKFNPNTWAFFGGLSENSESPVDTFLREMNEEIGIKFDEMEVITLCNYFNEEFQTHRYVFYMTSTRPISDFSLTEGYGLAWVNLNRLGEYRLSSKTSIDLKFFIKNKTNLQ